MAKTLTSWRLENGQNYTFQRSPPKSKLATCLLLGQGKGVPDQLCAVADEHLDQLGTGQLEEGGLGLGGAGTGHQGLARAGWTVQQDSLWEKKQNFVNKLLNKSVEPVCNNRAHFQKEKFGERICGSMNQNGSSLSDPRLIDISVGFSCQSFWLRHSHARLRLQTQWMLH